MDGSLPPNSQVDLPAPSTGVPDPTLAQVPPASNIPSVENLLPQTGGHVSQPGTIPSLGGQTDEVSASHSDSQPLANSPAIAEDVDLIEKEWVVKAKAIVAQTKDDPRKQNTEINRMKADYLKTRYKKDIKVNEA